MTASRDEDAALALTAPGVASRADAVAALVVVVGAICWNLHAGSLVLAESVASLQSKTSSAGIIGFAALRRSNAGEVVLAPGLSVRAHAIATFVVVVGTLGRNAKATLQGEAE